MKRILLLIILSCLTTIANAKTTSYTGKLKGYTPAWGFKTGKVIISDVVTGVNTNYLISISPDGTFTAEFPLVRDRECWISFPFFVGTVYFEAGKKLTQNFSFSPTYEVSSDFEGDGSEINNDMNKFRPILLNYNWDRIYVDIYDYSPEQHKAYFMKMEAQKLAAIDSVAKASGLSKTAYALATNDIKYMFAGLLISYNHYRNAAYRRHHLVSSDSRLQNSQDLKLEPAYYDFLQRIRYNDPAAIRSNNYYHFINNLKFLDLIYDKAGRIDYTDQINKLKQMDTTNQSIRMTLKHYREAMMRNATLPGALEKARPEVLKKLINKNITLELELMSLQDSCQKIDGSKIPMTDQGLARLKSQLKNSYLFPSVLQLNNQVKEAIASSKVQTGYVSHATPKAVADSVFDNIIAKYKGKVVVVDFWATWCAPCLEGIQNIKPLKEELKDKDIVFVYITNQTSPESTYKVMIPDIKGEHYRLSADEYNLIADRFKITGIPHYTIVNKEGIVVDNGAHFIENEKLKARLLEILDKDKR